MQGVGPIEKANAKKTPLISSVLHLLVLHNRPNRGLFICSKICWKSSKISKKVDNAICSIKKVDNNDKCPINVIWFEEIRGGAYSIRHRKWVIPKPR